MAALGPPRAISRLRSLATGLLLVACAAPLPEAPTPAATLAGRRRQDLEWLVAALERRHPDPYTRVGRGAFRRAVARLAVRGARLDAGDWFLELMRVVALVGDSHTRLRRWAPIEDRVLPVTFGAWQREYWVAGVQEGLQALTARRLVAVDGLPIEELEGRLAAYVPHENQVALRRGVARLLSYPRALRAAAGLDGGELRLDVVDLEGRPEQVRVAALTREQLGPWLAYTPPGWRPPLASIHPERDWWWAELDGGRTVYFHYGACRDGREPDFATFAAGLLARLGSGAHVHLIVDLRFNAGGDSRVLRPLLRGLRRLPAVRVTGLIGPETYSSAMLNAWELRRDLAAELVGEPTGQKPNSFGEIQSLTLPNSGLELDCSTRRFEIVEGDPPGLAPDRTVITSFADRFHGRDPVLEAARREAQPSTR